MRFELTAFSLARRRSTTELRPQSDNNDTERAPMRQVPSARPDTRRSPTPPADARAPLAPALPPPACRCTIPTSMPMPTPMPVPSANPLPDDEAHLWIARLDDLRDPALLAAYADLLADDEAEACARYRLPERRHEHLVTRALVRTVLSRYAGDVPPRAWRFTANAYGRPEIAGPAAGGALRFNLSNTRGLVVCLVARGREVGVDVEAVDRAARCLDVADHYFAPPEVAALRALPPAAQPERFLTYWTLKESYIKARGMGLSLPLERFAFVLDPARPDSIAIEIDPALGDHPDRWQFRTLRYRHSHTIATAVERRSDDRAPIRVVARETVPLVG